MTKQLPKHEFWEKGQQIRKSSRCGAVTTPSAKGIPAHIAEGYGRVTSLGIDDSLFMLSLRVMKRKFTLDYSKTAILFQTKAITTFMLSIILLAKSSIIGLCGLKHFELLNYRCKSSQFLAPSSQIRNPSGALEKWKK